MKKLLCACIMLWIQSAGADTSAQNLARYMMANYYQFGNDLSKAGHWYSQVTPDEQSVQIYTGYIPYLAASGAFNQIVPLIPQLDERFKNNQEMQLIFANALEQTGNKQEAQNRLVTLNEQHKANQELAFKVVQMYLERAEPENALSVIKNLLNNSPRRPNNFIFLFMESQIYMQLNKKPEALAAIKQCIETYPKFDKSWLLYAVLHEQEGKIEEAIKGYTTFLEISPQANAEIERHLIMLAYRQKMHTKQLPDGKKCLNLAAQFFDKKEYDKALENIEQCLAQTPHDKEAQLFKIQILAHQKQLEKAAQLLAQWMKADKEYDLWLQALHLLCYMGLPYPKAMQAIESVEKHNGFNLSLTLALADLALRAPMPQKALLALKKAAAATPDQLLKAQLTFQMGMLYFEQEQWKQAQQTLEQALSWGTSYAPLNNLLAYIYATKGNNLTLPSSKLLLHCSMIQIIPIS